MPRGPEDIVNRGHRVERAWESDEGRQLVDGLTDLDQLDTDIERRAVSDFSRRAPDRGPAGGEVRRPARRASHLKF
jgi:hypothetical protein